MTIFLVHICKTFLVTHGKESSCNAGDLVSIPGSGKSPGEGNGYPLQYSCLESSVDKGGWWAQFIGSQKVGHNLAIKHTYTMRKEK